MPQDPEENDIFAPDTGEGTAAGPPADFGNVDHGHGGDGLHNGGEADPDADSREIGGAEGDNDDDDDSKEAKGGDDDDDDRKIVENEVEDSSGESTQKVADQDSGEKGHEKHEGHDSQDVEDNGENQYIDYISDIRHGPRSASYM